MATTIQEIATVYGVAVEDVAVRVEFSTHLYISNKTLCGRVAFTDLMFDGVKLPTHANTFENGQLCKTCHKNLNKKMGA